MNAFPPVPAFLVAGAALVLALGTPLGIAPAAFARAAATAQSAPSVAATATTPTPIPPPTDEPTTAATTSAQTPSPSPSPRKTSGPRGKSAAPSPSPTPTAPPATDAPTSSPTSTPTAAPTAKARPRGKQLAPISGASNLGGYEPMAAYARRPEIAKFVGQPIAELAQIAWMSGTWQCTISTHERPSEPLKASETTTFVYDLTMNKRWLFGADGKGQEQHEFTYDPLAKTWVFVRLGYDPAYGIATSEGGWNNGSIRFEDTVEFADGREVHRRTTITKRSATHFTLLDEEQTPTGAWLLAESYDYTKS